MPTYIRNLEKSTRKLTIATISFMICWGLVLVLAQIKPFWIDEWRVIYNLKYKNPAALWGSLDFLQQFPRTYLEVIKAFSSLFDYSYFTLRFPSFLAGTFAIILCYRLMNKIYKRDQVNRFLFVLVIISSHAFTEYYVQVKQYTMEILLSILAIWQLLQLLNDQPGARRYALLCLSFLIAPFFSYTYPIVVAPLFIIAFVRTIHQSAAQGDFAGKIKWIFRSWLPLFICAGSIGLFYVADVSQLMTDKGMHQYWAYRMMNHGFDTALFFKNSFRLFAQVGGGMVFEIIFGIVGLFAFVFAMAKSCKGFYNKQPDNYEHVRLYSTLLLLLALGLFVAGKLPLGEARLNIFTVPAIAILVIHFLEYLRLTGFNPKLVASLTLILFAGVCGHIFTSSINGIVGIKNQRRLDIYVNTENAIILAQAKKIPILVTSGVAYPYDKVIKLSSDSTLGTTLCIPPGYRQTINSPLEDNIPGNWILETFPAYKVAENIDVYAINNTDNIEAYIKQLPPYVTSVLAGDGISFRIINRE